MYFIGGSIIQDANAVVNYRLCSNYIVTCAIFSSISEYSEFEDSEFSKSELVSN